jgi:hypothetical protein
MRVPNDIVLLLRNLTDSEVQTAIDILTGELRNRGASFPASGADKATTINWREQIKHTLEMLLAVGVAWAGATFLVWLLYPGGPLH